MKNSEHLECVIKRKHNAFINVLNLIELGILQCTIEYSETAGLEKARVRFKHFPSFSYFDLEYIKDYTDEFQRYNMLILMLQKHCIYIQNMQRFICRLSFNYNYIP